MGWERTLLFVAGSSPQVITETVWALCRQRPVPRTQVFVITTTAGRDHIEQRLLRRGGPWSRLQRDYPAARNFHFNRKQVLVLPGPDRQPLDDVRSEADSKAAGDFILDFVRNHTRPEHPPLHASIAGGRKTMGYLLATAMVLFGRVDDRLSHVLVRPPELEGSSFFYPPPRGRFVKAETPAGKTIEVQLKDVSIDLAELPFLRLRLWQDSRDLAANSFSELVQRLQQRLGQVVRPTVEIDVALCRLVCGGEAIHVSPLRVGIYALLARRRQSHLPGSVCAGCSRCFLPAEEIGRGFREELRTLMQQLKSVAVGKTWSERNFRPEISKLNALLEEKLGSASKPYEVQIRGERGQRLYGIAAAPELLIVSGLPTIGGNVATSATAVA
ncbi:MAG: CRISPR-associated ring nuclease Csm6 [Candidatus Binatia bacterium]|nr:CRISPR-associated ring nuclease Csm6 [Candidatus Binatia bacterium]